MRLCLSFYIDLESRFELHGIDTEKLYSLTKQVIDLAYDGLISRRQGEEKLLEPLYQRISLQTNPAKTMIYLKNSGIKLEEIIKEYAKIKQD